MGERDTAEREIEHARERLGEIADEVSRRVSPARIKAEVRERGTEMAQRAKEAALRKTTEVKDRAIESPTLLGLVGGVVGASVGAMLARRARDRQNREWEYRRFEGYGYGPQRRVARAELGGVQLRARGLGGGLVRSARRGPLRPGRERLSRRPRRVDARELQRRGRRGRRR